MASPACQICDWPLAAIVVVLVVEVALEPPQLPGDPSSTSEETRMTSPESTQRITLILAALPVGTPLDLRIDLERVRDAEAPMPEGWRLNRIAQLVAFHVAPKAEEPWRERVHAIARGEDIHA